MILCGIFSESSFGQTFWGPIKQEYLVGPGPVSTGIKNTGTDAIYITNPEFPSEGTPCWLQVSVCDGANAGFGWRIGSVTGFLPFATSTHLQNCEAGFTLTDPDVVVAYKGGEYGNMDSIFAKVVGIDPNGFTRLITYEWKPGGLAFEEKKPKCPCKYGAVWEEDLGAPADSSGYTFGRRCTSPNIDANQAGETVITWTEIENYKVKVTLGVPFPVPNTQMWRFKRGNVLSAVGDIADTCLGCDAYRLVFYAPEYLPSHPNIPPLNPSNAPWDFRNSPHPGFSVVADPAIFINPNSELFFPAGWYANSDVSISEKGDSTVISYAFFNYRYSGESNPLHVTQFITTDFIRCATWVTDWHSFSDYPGGKPRIASPTVLQPGSHDFHVVMGYSGSHFDCETYETSFSSNLGVIGVNADTMINAGISSNIIDNADLRGDINYDPCISYTTAEIEGSHSLSEYLAITWTNRGSDTTFDKGEIIGKLYQTTDAGEVYTEYSVVNQYMAGDQGVSSIAARRDIANVTDFPNIAYNWAEPVTGDLEMKQAHVLLGSAKLDGGIVCASAPPEEEERPAKKGIGFLLYPNPTRKEFTVLKNKEITPATFISCEVIDMLGRKIEVKVNAKTLEIIPASLMMPGVYKVKIVTNDKVFHSNLEIRR